jgi:hypothetical protein
MQRLKNYAIITVVLVMMVIMMMVVGVVSVVMTVVVGIVSMMMVVTMMIAVPSRGWSRTADGDCADNAQVSQQFSLRFA